MGFNAIHIDSAPSALVEQVLSQIETGRLAPGTCLPSQRELAKMFQVGLGTVREAIKILTVMGHLEVSRGKGTFVRDANTAATASVPGWRLGDQIDPAASPAVLQTAIEVALEAASLSDLLQTRQIIECGTAQLAAQVACPTGIERLEQLAATMSTRPETIEVYYRNDFDFHLAVAKATNNRALLEMVRLLMDRVHYCLDFMNHSLGISLPININNCVRSARRVIVCIAAGEAEEAYQAMDRHLDVVRSQLNKVYLSQRRGSGAVGDAVVADSSIINRKN